MNVAPSWGWRLRIANDENDVARSQSIALLHQIMCLNWCLKMPRYRAKVDRNQSEIIQALRSVGPHVSVRSLAGQGQGIPDLLCGISGVTFLIEVKDGAKSLSRQKLTPDQEDFIARWTGSPVVILRDAEEAVAWARERS